jgi:predicted Ser/Thr protein kinase
MLAPGTELGKYTIEGLIGQGGFGVVYRATQRGPAGFAQEVALKTVRPSARPEALAALAHEARVVARLRHRNIVQIYDFGHADALYYLVMEFIVGLTLKELFQRGVKRLPLWLKLGIAAEVTSGLRFAHAALDDDGEPLGLIHRDIKPSNILLSRQGDVKIADFGLAKLSRVPSEEFTAAGIVKGTPAYMSPEQRAGRPATPASDVYSLAAVLFELCTGVNPAPQLSQGSSRECVPTLAGQVISDAPAGLLRALDTILAAALSNDPSRRPTAAQFGDDLRSILQQAPDANPAHLGDALAQLVGAALGGARGPAVLDAPTATVGLDQAPWGQAALVERSLEPASSVEARTLVRVEAPEAGEVTSPKPRVAQDSRRRRALLVVAAAAVILATAVLLLVLLVVPSQPEATGWPDATVSSAETSTAVAAVPPRPRHDAASVDLAPETDHSDGPAREIVGLKARYARQLRHRQHGKRVKRRPRPKAKARPAETGRGWLSVNSRPWANVFVDGRRVASTPVFRHALPAGDHTVQLVTAGRQTVVRSVIIRRDEHLNLGMIQLSAHPR